MKMINYQDGNKLSLKIKTKAILETDLRNPTKRHWRGSRKKPKLGTCTKSRCCV